MASLKARLQRVLDSQYMVTEPQIAQPEELPQPALVLLRQVLTNCQHTRVILC